MDQSVHENSPKVFTKIHPFRPQKFALYVHEKSATQITTSNFCGISELYSTQMQSTFSRVKNTACNVTISKLAWGSGDVCRNGVGRGVFHCFFLFHGISVVFTSPYLLSILTLIWGVVTSFASLAPATLDIKVIVYKSRGKLLLWNKILIGLVLCQNWWISCTRIFGRLWRPYVRP